MLQVLCHLLASFILNVCVFLPLATGPNNLTVIQTPTKIHLSIGDSTEIACIWEKSIIRYRISWYLVTKENVTKTISSSLLYLPNVTHDNKDVLVLKTVNVNDTGFYYCEIIIEIPFCKKLCGSGTTLIVEEKGKLAWACACLLDCHRSLQSKLLHISSLSHILLSTLNISKWVIWTEGGLDWLLMTITLRSLY